MNLSTSLYFLSASAAVPASHAARTTPCSVDNNCKNLKQRLEINKFVYFMLLLT